LDLYRCFWLHLAIALGLNPFLLCCFFRIQHEKKSIQQRYREMGIKSDECSLTLESLGMETDSTVLDYIIPPAEFHGVEVTRDFVATIEYKYQFFKVYNYIDHDNSSNQCSKFWYVRRT
jgi:hypothetical protein